MLTCKNDAINDTCNGNTTKEKKTNTQFEWFAHLVICLIKICLIKIYFEKMIAITNIFKNVKKLFKITNNN